MRSTHLVVMTNPGPAVGLACLLLCPLCASAVLMLDLVCVLSAQVVALPLGSPANHAVEFFPCALYARVLLLCQLQPILLTVAFAHSYTHTIFRESLPPLGIMAT